MPFKKIQIRTIFTLLFLVTVSGLCSQNNKFLRELNKLTDTDTNKSILYIDVASRYLDISEYDSAYYYAVRGYKLSKTQKYVRGIYKNLNAAALALSAKGKNDKAIELLVSGRFYCTFTKNKKGEARLLNTLGVCETRKANYQQAINYYLDALKIEEELNTGKKQIANINNNIGVIYNRTKNNEQSLLFHRRALYIRKSINDSAGLAFSYNNLSNCYTHNTKTNSDSILYFLDLSLAIREKLKDRAGVAQNWNNIGNYYLNQEIPQKALEYYEKSYALNTELGILNERLNCLNNLSETYFDLKLFEKAKKYGEEALSAAKENAFIEMEKISYKKLAKTYSALGDFKRSSESFAKYVAINDTVFNQTLDEKLTEARINFSFETKEEKLKQEQKNKNELFAKEKRIQSIIIFSIGGGLILMLLVLVVLFRSYNLKKKANILISQQKLLVDEKNHVIEEKQKEIIDSINYAQRIQRSLLASDKLLKENLNNFFILFKPKDIVSGDFYWAKKLNNNCFALATADSTGHGVPGAIMSMLNIACLNEAVGKNITSPSEILFETRNRVIDHLKNDGSNEGGKDGMDCSLLCIDFKTLTLFAAAANNPVWIVRSINDQFELFELKPDKMPVGKHDKDQLPFTLHTFQLNKGDTIYTLTDGYPDQFGGEKGKKFMSKRLKELLLSNTGLSLQTQKEILQKTFNDWLGNLEQIDDVTIIGIKI